MNPTDELQKALIASMSAQYPTYGLPQPDETRPYIRYDREELSMVSTKTHTRTQHSVFVECTSRGTSSEQQKQMALFALDSMLTVKVEGFSVNQARLVSQSTTTFHNADSTQWKTITNVIYILVPFKEESP